ncbi:MAG: hypothetical protein KatS3mg022_2798 [Armatimonadota bacterium]|nr:MAG: hypothetical protein KatS3mg022_2798 [Armatimonadota bacterium]
MTLPPVKASGFVAGLSALGRLLAVGSEWGSYAAAPGVGGGARRAVREAAEEAGEQLARQTVRRAAREAGDEWVRLYRAVSLDELKDIQMVGRMRSGAGAMEGKWFATTAEHAAMWGKKLWKLSAQKQPYSIIEVRVPRSVLERMFYRERLDMIGPAYFAPEHLLPYVQFLREMPFVPWLR